MASADISGLQLTQPDNTNAETRLKTNTENNDINNLFIPSTPGSESTSQILSAIQQDTSNTFNTVETNSGVRIQLPTSSEEALAPQIIGPSIAEASTVEQQTLNSDNNSEQTITTKERDAESTDRLIWQSLAPADKAGMIPMLVSLNAQPQEETTVQLRTSNLNAFGSADINFLPENWNRPQLIWIDANQIEFNGESETLRLEVGLVSASNPEDVEIEILNITIQKPTPCTELICGATIAQAQEVDNENDPNLDLELSTIAEERSAFFLLLRASLSPFLVLTNMALHVIRQLQPEEATQVAKLELDSSAESQTIQQHAPEIKSNNIRFFDPTNWNTTSHI